MLAWLWVIGAVWMTLADNGKLIRILMPEKLKIFLNESKDGIELLKLQRPQQRTSIFIKIKLRTHVSFFS
ncbi:hypothetical protein D3C79_966370 [compost metagenome]